MTLSSPEAVVVKIDEDEGGQTRNQEGRKDGGGGGAGRLAGRARQQGNGVEATSARVQGLTTL